jgi:HD-like signal output (HDOD) protein
LSAQALATAAGFVQQLADDLNKGNLELPMFPDSVIRIQQAFRSEDTDMDEIIQIISSDPALAARVLQLSNSPAMRAAAEIFDVRQAVIRMGRKLVQSSAVSFALRQAEKNEKLSPESREQFKEIWQESVELAALCHVITKKFTKLSADEALLAGLLSVLGRLYIFMKSQDCGDIDLAEMDQIVSEWHPAICKAIAESWGMSDELVTALELQLESDPPLQESASLAEVLVAAKLVVGHKNAGTPLDGSEYPLLQRLGIAGANDYAVSLDAHEAEIDAIRQGLIG